MTLSLLLTLPTCFVEAVDELTFEADGYSITVAGNFYDLLRDVEAMGGDLEFRAPARAASAAPACW